MKELTFERVKELAAEGALWLRALDSASTQPAVEVRVGRFVV